MWNVKPSVTRVVGIFLRVAIAIYIVAIKIARKSYLTIASHTKSAALASRGIIDMTVIAAIIIIFLLFMSQNVFSAAKVWCFHIFHNT